MKFERTEVMNFENAIQGLDYEDWQKNPTPRKMWVWNDNEEEKIQKKVLYIFHRKGQE